MHFGASICNGTLAVEALVAPWNLTLCHKAAMNSYANNINVGSCVSISTPLPAACFTSVQRFLTLYPYLSVDGFSGSALQPLGDSVSIWSNNTVIWDYVVVFLDSVLGYSQHSPNFGAQESDVKNN